MRARSAVFLTSAANSAGFPAQTHPEVAFAGRSNVGKSSLINVLVGVHRLARTSQTPGRTRLLNWFDVITPKGHPLQFVDLPGYGYAKVSRDMRDSWRPLIDSYLKDREVLRGVVTLIDARRGAQREELELLEWLAEAGIPAIPVMTKSDKLPKSKRKPAALELQKATGLGRMPVMFSATKPEGVDDLWHAITKLAYTA